MRLIDADKLKREALCEICLSADCGDCFSDKAFEEWIASQPTAYDLGVVLQRLEYALLPVVVGRRDGKALRYGFSLGIAVAVKILEEGFGNETD